MNGIKDLKNPAPPVLRVKNRGGAPKGNRNAWKTGCHAAAAIADRKAFFARVADLKRRAWEAMAYADDVLAQRGAAANNAGVSD